MLLETLIALLVFSIGLLGFVALHSRAISLSADAQDRNRAALLASEMVSSMWLSGVNMADCGAWATKVADTRAAGLPNGQCAVVTEGKTTRITITWQAPTHEETSSYTTAVVLP